MVLTLFLKFSNRLQSQIARKVVSSLSQSGSGVSQSAEAPKTDERQQALRRLAFHREQVNRQICEVLSTMMTVCDLCKEDNLNESHSSSDSSDRRSSTLY